jgi:putative membrane protein
MVYRYNRLFPGFLFAILLFIMSVCGSPPETTGIFLMQNNNTDGSWRPVPLLVCNVAAVLLILSWYLPAGRLLWEPLDAWFFYTLNGSLAEGHYWQTFWAMANTQRFDIGSALAILLVYSFYLFSGSRDQFEERTTAGAFMLVTVFIAIQFSKTFLDYGRPGPSTTLQSSILLSEVITGFEFKDQSNSSFPGNYGIALIMFAAMIWYFAGRVYGLTMTGLTVLLLLPRLVVGAHWFTDNAVGAAYVSLIVLGWTLATPLPQWFIKKVKPLVSRFNAIVESILSFFNGGRENLEAELANAPRYSLKGFCMGSADIIPGVSGGTMALILGIYERLLRAIRSFDRFWVENVFRFKWKAAFAANDLLFLMPLVAGILMALIFFTRIVPLPALIVTHPEIIYGLFFGLIVASVVILMGEVERYGARQIFIALLGVLRGFVSVKLVPVETPTATWFIFLCGFVAISAMLLPGISGSFILLILGKYAYIINALGEFNIAVILSFGAGAFTGLIVFSRAIVWLLKHYHQATLLMIKGVLIGSLWIIWPFQERMYESVRGKEKMIGSNPVWPDAWSGTVTASVTFMLAGFVLVMVIHRLSLRHRVA